MSEELHLSPKRRLLHIYKWVIGHPQILIPALKINLEFIDYIFANMQDAEQTSAERFSKQLTQNEVDKKTISFRLSEVEGFFDFQEGRLFWLDVVGCTGLAWVFLGAYHTNEEMGSVVSISWPQFASEMALKADDEVVFERRILENDKAPWKKYKIVITRKIRLFGQDIWVDLKV